MKRFRTFLESLRESNPLLIESLLSGYDSCFESLSTDDANSGPLENNGNVSNPIVPMTAPILPGTPEKDEYFPETLSPAQKDLVKQSKFGRGRVTTYPAPGRDISSNDPGSNQFGAIQNTTGGAEP